MEKNLIYDFKESYGREPIIRITKKWNIDLYMFILLWGCDNRR